MRGDGERCRRGKVRGATGCGATEVGRVAGRWEIGRCGEGRWSGDRGGVGRGEAGRREIRRARGIVLVLQVHSAPLKKCFDDISPLGLLGSKPIGSSKKINFLEITTIAVQQLYYKYNEQ